VLTQVAAMIDTHALRIGAAEHPEDYPWCGFAAAFAGFFHSSSLFYRICLPAALWSFVG
jgi:hypothetical protein